MPFFRPWREPPLSDHGSGLERPKTGSEACDPESSPAFLAGRLRNSSLAVASRPIATTSRPSSYRLRPKARANGIFRGDENWTRRSRRRIEMYLNQVPARLFRRKPKIDRDTNRCCVGPPSVYHRLETPPFSRPQQLSHPGPVPTGSTTCRWCADPSSPIEPLSTTVPSSSATRASAVYSRGVLFLNRLAIHSPEARRAANK